MPAVGRLVSALAALASHCERLRAIPVLARAQITVPFSNDVQPVIALTALRYPDALDGDPGYTFRDYHSWLAGLELLERYPLFLAEFDAVFLEADLLLAMYAGRFRTRVFSCGHERVTVNRFIARIADPAQREALAELFTGDGALEDRLEKAYASVEGTRRSFDSVRRACSSPSSPVRSAGTFAPLRVRPVY